jgi:hypothetical protein
MTDLARALCLPLPLAHLVSTVSEAEYIPAAEHATVRLGRDVPWVPHEPADNTDPVFPDCRFGDELQRSDGSA